jgi:hypothetical protein
MKKLWSLLALILAFVILIGSYFYIKNKPKETKTPEATSSVTSEQLLNVDKDKITKMTLSSKSGDLVIEKKDSKWVATGSSAKLEQNNVDGIASSFAELSSSKVIEENAADLTKYGLKQPSVTAKVTLQGGEEKTVYLGDKTPTGTSYYLMVKDVNKVYAVDARYGTNFSYTIDALRDLAFANSLDITKINYFKEVPSQGKVVEIKANEAGLEGQEYGINVFSLIQPYKEQFSIDSTKFQDVIKVIPEIKATEIAEDNAKDLSKYGLDKPKLEVMAKDTDNNTFHIYIGKDASDSLTYFRLEDSNVVYKADKTQLDSLSIEPFKLISRFAYLVNIDDVDRVVVQTKDKKYESVLSRTLTKKAEKEGDKDEYATTYKVNGKDIVEADYKKYYQVVVGLLLDAESEKTVPENPEVTITYYLNKGDKKEVVVKYVPYDNNFYAVYKNGISQFVISKDKLNAMLSASEQLVK